LSGYEPVGHLLLHHHGELLNLLGFPEEGEKEPCSHVVWQIGDHLPWSGAERVWQGIHGVLESQLNIGTIADNILQDRTQADIDLVRDHVGPRVGECHRECACARPHFEYLIIGSDAGHRDHLGDDVRISEEVLTEPFARHDSVISKQPDDRCRALRHGK
jgi:hypothetical protein